METFHKRKKQHKKQQFKSYYVVWKRNGAILRPKEGVGLNRTMQYGNFQEARRQKAVEEGLNRTMQYGNSFAFFIFLLDQIV